jgi:hypothetical protein
VRRMSCGECVEACIGEERRMSEDTALEDAKDRFMVDSFIAHEERALEVLWESLAGLVDRNSLCSWIESRKAALEVFRESVMASRKIMDAA